ncbi:glycosyltransferase family 4 protein [Candidatus Peregrinibacteria bacterium]|nr:glycosyltransferase family 4 protein [Candidatus Peregrinibacteria bacterium]
MKLGIATGIYPPDIGGPATYVRALAEELTKRGHEVTVITYGRPTEEEEKWKVVRVSKRGLIIRWIRYAAALKKNLADADAIIAFSSVSAGVPLWLAGLSHPKKILRLGGDFLWERYTDRGGNLSLSEWYEKATFSKMLMRRVLGIFDHLVFSTHYQQELYERSYRPLPPHSVIENAFPAKPNMAHNMRLLRTGGLKGDTMRLLFLGRFVRFKNVASLLRAIASLRRSGTCRVTLSIVGDGPEESHYLSLIRELHLEQCVTLRNPVHGQEKQRLFAEHDLLVLPSLTEISPNVALEAAISGLPVLLTSETGLSPALTGGMMLRPLRTSEQIVSAILDAEQNYGSLAGDVHSPLPQRSMRDVADAFLSIAANPPLPLGFGRAGDGHAL